jgi:hypothetical protein
MKHLNYPTLKYIPNPAVSELVISNENFTKKLDYKIICLPGHFA